MKAIIQRVTEASVTVDNVTVGKIKKGYLILLGVAEKDKISDITWLIRKVSNLRIFNDLEGIMNLSIKEVEGEILCISQFTLLASTKKGNRPSYLRAARPEVATEVYDTFCELLSKSIGTEVQKGIFGADMKVSLINDGPVTIVLDTHEKE